MGAAVTGGVVSSGLTHYLTKSYREAELDDLKNDYERANEDRDLLRKNADDLRQINQKLMGELTVKVSQLSDCRDFLSPAEKSSLKLK